MSIHRRRRRLERRRILAGEWRPSEASGPDNKLFERSFDLAEAARDLERVAGARGSAAAMAAALGCATSTFESLANSMLKMRGPVLRETVADRDAVDGTTDPEQIGRMLFAISQNLRFAAEAADLGRKAAEDRDVERAAISARPS